ncbi:hypothetical protein [Kribbella antibiotica]|uniref:hypothetical protein n=1 Tax=Kribbella antibiotica TaxID=190195 RepID=UPI00192E2B2C|nr:hypothetical protein [Kribbella antibiotica]
MPGLNPTAGLVGRLDRMGIEHLWRDQAAAWCAEALAKGFSDDAHATHESMEYLEHTEARDVAKVREWLPKPAHYCADAADPSYRVTTLHFAPTLEYGDIVTIQALGAWRPTTACRSADPGTLRVG